MGRYAQYATTTTTKKVKKKKERKTIDISDIDKLKAEAERRGLEVKEKKPSLFRRTLDVISRPLYASAGAAKAIIKGENVAKEVWKGFRGVEKETYSDVLSEMGVKNKWVKGIAGFALDVALDPTTYFGGAIIKGGLKATKAVVRPIGKVGAKIAPESALHLADASKSLNDAFGAAFKFGHGTTKGLADDVSRSINKMGIAKEEIIEGNIKMMGKKYSKKELAEAGELMIKNRRIELQARKGIKALPKAEKEIGKAIKPITKAVPDKNYKYTYYHATPKSKQIEKQGFKDDTFVWPTRKIAENYAKEQGKHWKVIKVKSKEKLGATAEGLTDDYKMDNPELWLLKKENIKPNKKQLDLMAQTKKFDQTILNKADIWEGEEVVEKIPKYATSKNPKINELLTIFKSKAKEIAKKADIDEATAYENYFPFLRLDKLKPIEQSTALLKKGAEGYKKQFRDLIKDDNLLKKPIEAYSRREFEVVRNKLVRSTLDDMVKTYGKGAKAFKNVDEAIATGYKPIYERGFKAITAYPVKTAAGKTVKAIGKPKAPLGYLKEADAKFIDNYLFPEFKTIDVLAKASRYDAFTRWFKTWVTAYFPAFHIRNYISGNVQNYQVIGAQALNPQNHNTALGILRGGKKSVPIKIGKYTGSTGDLNKVMKENFRGASRYISDIGDYIEEIVGVSNKFKIKKVSKMRNIGNFVELNQKAVAMTGALRQGKTLKQAIKIAEMAGFDYTKITKFESKIMRRAVPFYTFARKNAELQAKTFIKHPERIINQAKLAKNLEQFFGGEKPTEEELKMMPEWMLNGLGFNISGDRIVTKFGLPLEEFIERIDRPLKTTLTSLNPYIKYPLENELGYNFFREKKIKELNTMDAGTAEALPKALQEWFELKPYEYKGKKYYKVNAKKIHFLENTPLTRFFSTFKQLQKKDRENFDKVISFISGIKIYTIDHELNKYFSEKELRRDIEDQLMSKGYGYTFGGFALPKE